MQEMEAMRSVRENVEVVLQKFDERLQRNEKMIFALDSYKKEINENMIEMIESINTTIDKYRDSVKALNFIIEKQESKTRKITKYCKKLLIQRGAIKRKDIVNFLQKII